MQSWTRKGTHTKSLRRKRSKLFHYAPKLWPLHSSPPHFLSSFTTQRKSYKRNHPKIHQQHSTISLSSLSQNTPYYARSIRSPGLPHLIPSLMILSFLHRRNQPTKTLTLRIAPILSSTLNLALHQREGPHTKRRNTHRRSHHHNLRAINQPAIPTLLETPPPSLIPSIKIPAPSQIANPHLHHNYKSQSPQPENSLAGSPSQSTLNRHPPAELASAPLSVVVFPRRDHGFNKNSH